MGIASVASATRSRFWIAPRDLLVWVAFFLVVVSARLVLVAHFSSAMPLMDQWDDEGARIFTPYLEGTLRTGQLFAAHNEHRPVVARLVALGLLRLNGQWDGHVQMIANAVIAGVAAIVIAAIGVRCLGARHRTMVLAAVAFWSCLPYGWENTTWAFQSSFYFLLLFSLVAIRGLIAHAAFTGWWILGATAALLSCFSMASGFLSAAAVLLVALLRAVARRTRLADSIATVAVCGIVITLGVALRVHVPDHDALRPGSLLAFAEAFARCLSWPASQHPLGGVVVYAPVALLAATYFARATRERTPDEVHALELIIGVAAWVLLQAAAIAYSRGGVLINAGVSSRYMDVLGVGVLANFLAINALLAGNALRGRNRRATGPIIAACWSAAVLLGLAAATYKGFRQMTARAEQVRQAEAHVRAYLATGDIRRLGANATAIAYPWPERFVTLLAPSAIRRILPASIRPPLTLEPDGSSGAFVLQTTADGERIWSSEILPDGAHGGMRSQLLRATLPRVRLEMRGALGEWLALKFRDEHSGQESGARFGARQNGWRVGYAQTGGPFRIIARDEDEARSLAFTEPVELGTLSYFAGRILAASPYILAFAGALSAALAVHAQLRTLHSNDAAS